MDEGSHFEKERSLSAAQAEEIVIVGGSSHSEHASAAAEYLNTSEAVVDHRQFPDGELYSVLGESARGKRVFIVQTDVNTTALLNQDQTPSTWSVNDSIQQTALLIDTAVRASAREVTVIKPYMAYSRQDRKLTGREPISIAAHIQQYQALGMDRLVTIDLHSPQSGIIQKQFDNISATGRLVTQIRNYLKDYDIDPSDVIYMSPDGGSLKLPAFFAGKLGGRADVMAKTRHDDGSVQHTGRVEGVGGRTCVLVDDMIATAGTIESAVEILKNSGAEKIGVAATHGIFSGQALERLEASDIDRIMVTDTIPQKSSLEKLGSEKLDVREISSLIGKAIFEISTDGSISDIFENGKAFSR